MAQNRAEEGGHQIAPQDTQTRSRLVIGEDGPSDSARAASSGGRLRRPAAERHAARCASRALCSGGAPRRYSPSMVIPRTLRFRLRAWSRDYNQRWSGFYWMSPALAGQISCANEFPYLYLHKCLFPKSNLSILTFHETPCIRVKEVKRFG